MCIDYVVLTHVLLGLQELQTKEIKNARLAMVAFVGFIVAAQATGQVMRPTSWQLMIRQCIPLHDCPAVCSPIHIQWRLLIGLDLLLQPHCMPHAVMLSCQWICEVTA